MFSENNGFMSVNEIEPLVELIPVATKRSTSGNGRTYNPLLARFTGADPIIQAPMNMQNYNSYSYVLNNPLMYTDPSGYQTAPLSYSEQPVFAMEHWLSYSDGWASNVGSNRGMFPVMGTIHSPNSTFDYDLMMAMNSGSEQAVNDVWGVTNFGWYGTEPERSDYVTVEWETSYGPLILDKANSFNGSEITLINTKVYRQNWSKFCNEVINQITSTSVTKIYAEHDLLEIHNTYFGYFKLKSSASATKGKGAMNTTIDIEDKVSYKFNPSYKGVGASLTPDGNLSVSSSLLNHSFSVGIGVDQGNTIGYTRSLHGVEYSLEANYYASHPMQPVMLTVFIAASAINPYVAIRAMIPALAK